MLEAFKSVNATEALVWSNRIETTTADIFPPFSKLTSSATTSTFPLNYDEEEDAYVVPYTKDELKSAPSDTIDELTKNDGHAYRDQAFAFYKVDQYWT